MPKTGYLFCNKMFYAKPSHIKKGWGKYCSKNCQYRAQRTGKDVTCYMCNKTVYRSIKDQNRSKSGNFFCSKSCQTLWRNKAIYSGKNHFNWSGGKASYRNILTRTNTPRECLRCECVDSRVLAVHHKDRNRDNNKISNLIWLCHNCHFLVHNYNNESEGFMVPVA